MEAFGLTSPQTYSSALGEFVSQDHVHIARVLHDYNRFLELVYIPKEKRDATDVKPFAIRDTSPGKPPHIVRFLSEQEMKNPQDILQWVFEGDLNKHRPGDVMNRIMAEEAARNTIEELRKAEEAMDRQDKLAFLVSGGRDRKSYVRHNGKTFSR
jgi:hypothetical protein